MATPNYTVTGTLDNLIGGMDTNGYLIFTLVNYGNDVPRVSGTSIVVQPSTKVIAANGTFSVALWGNDQITPGSNLLPTQTYYTVEIFSDTNQKLQAAAYRFVGTGTVDLSTLVPLSSTPAVSTPNGLPVFTPIAGQFLTGFNGQQYFAGKAGFVDCGLVGDGVTDDAPALNACIAANQGRHILLQKKATTPSGTDYFFGSAITLLGNGMILEGETGGFVGGTTVQFPAGTKGFIINNATCQGCTLGNLNILGSSPFTTTLKSQCVIPSTMEGANAAVTGTSTDDGVQVGGDFTRLHDLYITGWGRHGVYFTGGEIAGTFADDAYVQNVISYGNRGDGFYGHGGDFNAGVFINAIAYNNQFWGIHDSGFLGNTWTQPQVTGNHQDNAGVAGGTTAVTISRTASVVTVAAFTGHGLVVGNAFVISGSSDATYNGTWFVASVINPNSITFTNAAGATSGVTANARIATCTEAWAASGLDGGSYKAVGVAQVGSWINPYAELSNGGPAKFGGHNLVLNGNPTFDTTQQNYHYSEAGFHGSSYTFTANDASHPNVQLVFQPIQTSGSTLWSFVDGVGGTEDYRLTASTGSWQMADQRAGGGGFRLFSGGIAQVDGGGGTIRLNSFSGTGVQFGNGAGVFPLTANGNGTLVQSLLANGLDFHTATRFTDTSPTGNFQNFKNAAAASLWRVDITGTLQAGTVLGSLVSGNISGTSSNVTGTVVIGNGGTGQTTAAAAFNALSPLTTSGDVLYGGASGAGTRLAANATATNKYLQSVSSGIPAWSQVAFTDLSGSASAAQMPALTGDVTSSAGTVATTVGKINGTAFAGTSGNIVTFGASNTPVDSGVTLSTLFPKALNAQNFTGQSGSIASTNLVTSAVSGLYRASFYVADTVVCGTRGPAAVQINLLWTDEIASNVAVLGSVPLGTGLGHANIGTFSNAPTVFWVNSTSNIQFQTVITGCTSGSATYNLRTIVERLA